MIRPRCAHCDTPLVESARSCDRCGAPASFAYGTHPAPPGYATYEDPWRGFRVAFPAGWRVVYPQPKAVLFTHPQGVGRLCVQTLGALPGATPDDIARMALATFSGAEARVLRSGPQETSVAFRAPTAQGQVHVHRSGEGAIVAVGESFDGSFDPTEAIGTLLGSMAAVPRLERTAFTCPYEGSLRIWHPRGWTVQSTIAQNGNIRTPMCRVAGDPSGQILVACEADNTLFTHAPPPRPAAPQGGGFFAALGAFARQLDTSMGFGPPAVHCELGHVVETFYVPRFIQAIPGSTFERLDRLAPTVGDVRMRLPGDLVRVVRIFVVSDPQSPMWSGYLAGWIQAPGSLIERLEPTLRGVADSFEIDAGWRQRDQMRFQGALRAQEQHSAQMLRMQQQHSQSWLAEAAKRTQIIADTGASISDMQMAGWQDRQASSDWSHHGAINAINERTDFQAADATIYNVSSSFERVWSDTSGNLFGGDWSVDPPADWTELRKLN